MEIRNTRPDELSAVMGIYASAREFMAKAGNPDQWGDGYPSEALVRSDIEAGKSFVCVEGEEILAVFYYSEGVDPTYIRIDDGAWLDDDPYGVIHRIAVAAQGRGVVRFCFDWGFARCGNLKIDTHEKNIPMQRALEKSGFARCGTIYIETGESRIAYQKSK